MKKGYAGLSLYVLCVFLLAPATGRAASFYNVTEDSLIRSSPLVVDGRVGFIKSVKEGDGRIFTLVGIDVEEVLRGSVNRPRILLRILGGEVGAERQVLFGSPGFVLGERVVVYLRPGKGGFFRVNGLALGKFSVENDTLRRNMDRLALYPGPDSRKTPLRSSMARGELRRRIARAVSPGPTAPSSADPAGPRYLAELEGSRVEIPLPYTLLPGPFRYFPADIPYEMQMNPANNPFGNPTTAEESLQDGFDAWNLNPTSSIIINVNGTSALPGGWFTPDVIAFDDPDGDMGDDPSPGNCAGTLAIAGSNFSSLPPFMTVNGTDFRRATGGNMIFNNGWTAADGCSFLDQPFKLAEVAAHEAGHILGLDHSNDPDALMEGFSDGTRGAVLGADDIAGIAFIYLVQKELVLDFGSGVGVWANYDDDAASWRRIHPFSAEGVVAGDLNLSSRDDLILDFGSGVGVWANYDDDPLSWRKVHDLSPELMAVGDLGGTGRDDLILDFGSATGVWANYDNDPLSWRLIHAFSPELMAVGDLDGTGRDDLIFDFGSGAGVWANYDDNPASWRMIHPFSPEGMTAGDLDGSGSDDLVLDFGAGVGVWVNYDDDPSSWRRIHPFTPELMTVGDLDGTGRDDLVFDFGSGVGVWANYNDSPSTWRLIHAMSPESLTVGNTDRDAEEEVILDFGSAVGVWTNYNDNPASWRSIHPASPEKMTTGNLD